MRNWLLKLEAMAAAVAFAEQSEWDMARGVMQETERKRTVNESGVVKRSEQRTRRQTYRA
jgi:hypothetical protein